MLLLKKNNNLDDGKIVRILFWNTYKKKINQIIYKLWCEYQLDLIILTEYTDDVNELVKMINNPDINQCMTIGCDKIKMVGNTKRIQPGLQDEEFSIQIVDKQYLLCGVHFLSKIFSGNERKREIRISEFLENVVNEENKHGLKAVITGDFNLNPYDDSCLDAAFLHALPSRQVAKRLKRTVSNRSFNMFYNPMWNLLGDFDDPPGTYYYGGSDAVNPFWNIYDQVIIRPELIPRFNNDALKIVTHADDISLLNRQGHPDKNISDHLPIIFEMRNENE